MSKQLIKTELIHLDHVDVGHGNYYWRFRIGFTNNDTQDYEETLFQTGLGGFGLYVIQYYAMGCYNKYIIESRDRFHLPIDDHSKTVEIIKHKWGI